LLIYRLQDNAGAYVFSQNEAERLSVNPAFRQFDPWFLNEAIKRNDPTAMAKRLNASISAGVSEDLLNASYGQYFIWIRWIAIAIVQERRRFHRIFTTRSRICVT
jgi:hypothetical protein